MEPRFCAKTGIPENTPTFGPLGNFPGLNPELSAMPAKRVGFLPFAGPLFRKWLIDSPESPRFQELEKFLFTKDVSDTYVCSLILRKKRRGWEIQKP
jgi:hypothetical protein